ncbi:hypothetical protein [Planctomycetes bacterium CA13]
MGHRLEPLLKEIRALETLVSDKIHDATEAMPFHFENGKPVFGLDTRRHHRTLIKRTWKFLREAPLLAILTTPVIYSLLIPISLLDLLVCVFQWICFPIYCIPVVRRADYVVLDRHRLAYLNVIERINCVYCGYANGVLAFAREVASRTEQYWCPIKHARRVNDSHDRQSWFCEYGDGDTFRREYETLRQQFDDVKAVSDNSPADATRDQE